MTLSRGLWCYNLRMNRPAIEAAQVNMNLAETEALNGVPDFLALPPEMTEKIQDLVLQSERMFWLRSKNIVKDIVNTTMLRRALYAEHRVNETEHMLAEMAMITEGAKERIEELQRQLSDLSLKIE